MPSRNLAIDFYKVVMPQNSPQTFSQVLQSIHDERDLEERNRTVGDYPVRMQESGNHRHCWEGDMVKIRMEHLPMVAGITGSLNPLQIQRNEGVGEETAFLYDPATDVIMVQRNRYGVSANSLAHYCARFAAMEMPIIFELILRRDALRKLNRMNSIRRLRVKVAGPNRADFLRNQGHSVDSMTRIMQEFGALAIDIQVSMGRSRGRLNVEAVKTVARNIFQRIAESAERDKQIVEVQGGAEGEPTEILNLVKNRFTDYRQVNLDNNRTLNYADRRNALRASWDHHRAELGEMFQGNERNRA